MTYGISMRPVVSELRARRPGSRKCGSCRRSGHHSSVSTQPMGRLSPCGRELTPKTLSKHKGWESEQEGDCFGNRGKFSHLTAGYWRSGHDL